MKQLWRYLAGGLVCFLAACSSGEERVAQPTTVQPSPAAATTIAGAATPGRPTPTFVPTGAQPPAASQPAAGGATPITLDNPVWQGSYLRSTGNTEYGGRTAAWIYGSSTQFSTMQATFNLQTQPQGTAQLSIEGMDSEGTAKTPIRIRVNGTEIFNGPNPLPDDDLPLDTGTWATYTWSFDAGLLRPGQNTISISNLAPGNVGRPPFFMLDYAEVRF